MLIHAIADALLGTISAADIGHHFPNTDESIRGIRSTEILAKVVDMVTAREARIINVDATLIAEAPKIAPHLDRMRASLASHLRLPVTRVSVKATTNEKLGFLGRAEGIAAMAVASVMLNEVQPRPGDGPARSRSQASDPCLPRPVPHCRPSDA